MKKSRLTFPRKPDGSELEVGREFERLLRPTRREPQVNMERATPWHET